ncbi:MAG TPA: N-acetylmuramoyl-L-alanine amidase [Acidimicrobiales bacterium]|nr:N-acetylmuramoyl-L-alanine amidase [Acidimicrobiales bacterium]
MRFAVAALFVASVVAAGAMTLDRSDRREPSTTTAPPGTAPAPPPSTEPPPPPPVAAPPPPAVLPQPVSPEQARVIVSERGVVLPVRARVAGGYRVETPCGNTALVRSGTPLGSAAVVLDPGHGGDEHGATGPGGLPEKTVNLAVANYARAALEEAGATVVLTRTGDYRMTLGARASVAHALRPRAFVSIHHNADPDGPRPGPGTETFRQVGSDESKRLSGLIYEEVIRTLAAYPVRWVADRDAGAKYRTNSRGGDYYGILRQSRGVTAVLAELAFISNPAEEALLARADVQKAEGEAVARAVLRFVNTDDPGSGYTEPYPRSTPAGPGGGRAGCTDPPL